MQKKTIAMLGAATVLGVSLVAWAFAPRPVLVETATPRTAHFETWIEEDGKTRVRDRYVVAAPLAGVISRITLREGDRVEAGGAIATLAPGLAPLVDERTLREQQVQVDIARANAQRVEARKQRAEVALRLAQLDAARTEELASQGFVAPTKLDADRLALAAARKELDAAREDGHVAEHEVEQARAALMAVQAARQGGVDRAFTVRSPVAGSVLRVVQASEGPVSLGTPLVEVGDTSRLEIVAELLTTDALQAHPGSRVRIDRWGGPGTLEGVVRLVEPGAFTKVSALGVEEQRVRVLVDVTSPHERWQALGDAYRVSVRIVTQSVDDVMTVPVSAVFPVADGSGQMAVFAIESGRARLVPVDLGGRNGSDAWVRKGLRADATVIVYPPSTVKDGVRVSPRKS